MSFFFFKRGKRIPKTRPYVIEGLLIVRRRFVLRWKYVCVNDSRVWWGWHQVRPVGRFQVVEILLRYPVEIVGDKKESLQPNPLHALGHDLHALLPFKVILLRIEKSKEGGVPFAGRRYLCAEDQMVKWKRQKNQRRRRARMTSRSVSLATIFAPASLPPSFVSGGLYIARRRLSADFSEWLLAR